MRGGEMRMKSRLCVHLCFPKHEKSEVAKEDKYCHRRNPRHSNLCVGCDSWLAVRSVQQTIPQAGMSTALISMSSGQTGVYVYVGARVLKDRRLDVWRLVDRSLVEWIVVIRMQTTECCSVCVQ